MMDRNRLRKVLSRFDSARVFIIGDLILDVFIWGRVRRISPEAPVPVVEVQKDTRVPGGAANVANNIRALGAQAWISGVLGRDLEARILLGKLREQGIHTDAVLTDNDRPTSLKTRVVAHHQQVVRIDREVSHSVNGACAKRLAGRLEKLGNRIGAILIEDYGKGVISQPLVSRIVEFAAGHSIPVAVDPKNGHRVDYRGITFATPNFEEAAYFAGIHTDPDDHSRLDEIGNILLDKWQCRAVLITLGAEGMCLFERGRPAYRIPTVAREVFDVSGAGDTVIATFVISVLSGATLREAATLANLSAGIVVGKLGTAVVSRDEIGKELEHGS